MPETGLKGADAAIIASSLVHKAQALYTFDTDMLNLSEHSGLQNGSGLLICEPPYSEKLF